MEVKNFNIIITNLNNLINRCEKTIGHIKSKDHIDNMTLKDIREMITQCRLIYGEMDKVNTIDLYHIIGMGNLSASQRLIFWNRMEKFLSYRPDLHNICTLNIPDTPGIPAATSFKCKVLGNVTLTNVR